MSRIQGIARDECWVDHMDVIIDTSLLNGSTLAEPYESLYVNVPGNIIEEIGADEPMPSLCQFPKANGSNEISKLHFLK